jgi:hypothetical protein
MGLVMGLLLALENTSSTSLYSDHLNLVQFIEDLQSKVGQETKLRTINGRSYYRWIMDLVSRTRTSVIHTKSHTNNTNLALLLNNEVDHYASRAQNATHRLPSAPIPTFYMEDIAFYRDSDGWIESNIRVFTDYFLARQTAKALSFGHHHTMTTWLYDPRPPPLHPYTRASSAYSAMVQLYARSGQLPTASGMKQKGQIRDSRCRYGFRETEDMYHVFVRCERFRSLRLEVAELVVKKVGKRIEEYNLQESLAMGLLEAAKLFFSDSDVFWLLHYSTYYLGHVPQLDPIISVKAFANSTIRACFLFNIHSDFHLAGICLASWIWGMVQKDMAKRREGIIMTGMRT